MHKLKKKKKGKNSHRPPIYVIDINKIFLNLEVQFYSKKLLYSQASNKHFPYCKVFNVSSCENSSVLPIHKNTSDIEVTTTASLRTKKQQQKNQIYIILDIFRNLAILLRFITHVHSQCVAC